MLPSTSIRLEVESGPNKGHSIRVSHDQEIIVGRGANAAFKIVDPRISRKHFCIQIRDNRWQIRDLDSQNGTTVNDEIVALKTLNHDDRIRVGDTMLRVQIECN